MVDRHNRIVVLLTFLSILFLDGVAFSQQAERFIDKLSWRTEPIQIVKIKANGKSVELGRKFQAGEDWLNGLIITTQNVSEKAIVRVELTLAFPPPKGSSPPKPTVVVPMVFGTDPALESPSVALKLVNPGDRVEIELLEGNLPSIRKDLERLGYGVKVTHAQIRIRSVTFIDGSQWIGDEVIYPNPNNPKKGLTPPGHYRTS